LAAPWPENGTVPERGVTNTLIGIERTIVPFPVPLAPEAMLPRFAEPGDRADDP
jgi:hypothetical protein